MNLTDFVENLMKAGEQASYVAACCAIAAEAHASQTRWDGSPYMTHVDAVYRNVLKITVIDKLVKLDSREFCLVQCAAILHDVIEDCYTEDTLKKLLCEVMPRGFVADLMVLLRMLTHSRDETYDEYISGITHKLAIIVKYADLQHNMSCSMGAIMNNTDIVRVSRQMKKYGPAILIIANKLDKCR